jgi:hypothetical protein
MNIFNHKTKFFFLWEYIEDIQLVPATLALMGSPCLLIIFRKGRGFDAKRGAKQLDCEGVADFSIILTSGPSSNNASSCRFFTRMLLPEFSAINGGI